MSNLLQTCGEDWFSRRVSGAWMVLDAQLIKVMRPISATEVEVYNDTIGDRKVVPASVFTGFKVFNYPEMGYRKLSGGIAAWMTKQHGVNRGIRADHLEIEWSPASLFLYNAGYCNKIRVQETDKVKALFFPQYDKPQDLSALRNGHISTVVLSADLLVEPSIYGDEDAYTIFYRKERAGRMLPDGAIEFATPEYKKLLSPFLIEAQA